MVRNGLIAHITDGAFLIQVRAILRCVRGGGTAVGAAFGGLCLAAGFRPMILVVLGCCAVACG